MSGNLSKTQFEVLSSMEAFSRNYNSVRSDLDETVITELMEHGYISGDALTEKGYEALEPYRVKRAILVAAGFGSRMVPITINTPKPLVRVHGVRIIETILDAILSAGIEDIFIIRGYLGEQFEQLLHKYPMIKFIDNPAYDKGNNILSLRAAGDLIAGSYIFDSDILINNASIVKKYQYYTHYIGLPVSSTDDWCLTSDEGIINGMVRGGVDCHLMFGYSYWTIEDGLRLAKDINAVCTRPDGAGKYWDEVALECFKDDFQIHIEDCKPGDIVEIDSFSELCAVDSAYVV